MYNKRVVRSQGGFNNDTSSGGQTLNEYEIIKCQNLMKDNKINKTKINKNN